MTHLAVAVIHYAWNWHNTSEGETCPRSGTKADIPEGTAYTELECPDGCPDSWVDHLF